MIVVPAGSLANSRRMDSTSDQATAPATITRIRPPRSRNSGVDQYPPRFRVGLRVAPADVVVSRIGKHQDVHVSRGMDSQDDLNQRVPRRLTPSWFDVENSFS